MRTVLAAPLMVLALAACGGAAPAAKVAAPPPRAVGAAPALAKEAAPKPATNASDAPRFDEREVKALAATLAAAESARNAPPRAAVVPEAFRVEDLPLASLPAPLSPKEAPHEWTGALATELVVDWKSANTTRAAVIERHQRTSLRVSVAGAVFGRIRIGYSEGTIERDGAGGSYVTCGEEKSSWRRLTPARWETISPAPDGALQIEVTHAWFDPSTCSATVVERGSARAAPLPGRVLYAFRQAREEGRGEELTLIGPPLTLLSTTALGGEAIGTSTPFSFIKLPVQRGGAASLVARSAASSLSRWTELLGGQAPANASVLLVGVEISQGVDDPSPLAITYAAPADPFAASSAAPKPTPRAPDVNVLDPFLGKRPPKPILKPSAPQRSAEKRRDIDILNPFKSE